MRLSEGVRASAWEVAADAIYPPELKWRRDPALWARERLKAETWSRQREILESVRDHRLTAVHSCHEIGKSWTAAATVCWWLDTHPAGEARVVTTAPTNPQVKAILWHEINKMHQTAGLRGRTNQLEWYINEQLVAFGRKPSEHDQAAFQGIHARYILVVLDEASGIPKELWDAASTLAANEHSRMLAIGNPDLPYGDFFDVCKKDSDWHVIGVGYRDTPNFTGEEVSQQLKDMLIHPSWVENRRKNWGEQSALFQAKCEGLFPTAFSEWSVVPHVWATQCRYLEYPEGEPIEAGVDVAAGGDRTVIRERRGVRAGRVSEFRDPDPMRTVGRLVDKINEWGIQKVKIDVIGVGWGVYGRLRELSTKHNQTGVTTHNAEVVPFNSAEKPTPGNEKKFLNKRAEIWWNVGREYSRLKRWDLSECDDDVIAELTTPRYEPVDSSGKIKVQAKNEIRKELGASPDHADALLLAFWETSTVGHLSGTQRLAATNLLGGFRPL